jgi:hypothetical protein
MSKLFQKIKKWISGLTSVLLLVGIIAPTIVSANVVAISVDALTTSDTTPTITGTVADTEADVTVTVDGSEYIFESDGGTIWTVTVSNALVGGAYEVVATDGVNFDETTAELFIDVVGPTLTEKTPVSESGYTNKINPAYTFSSDEVGEVTYSGSCGVSTLTTTVVGFNTVTFGPLTDGVYNDCSIIVTDNSDNSSALNVTPFTVDTEAPVLTTPLEFAKLGAGDVEPNVLAIENFLTDEGVVVTDNNDEVDIATTWELIEKVETDVATYKVTYLATDLAGNLSNEVEAIVHLGTETVEIIGTPLELNGEAAVVAERGVAYEDKGAHVLLNGEAIHVWTVGNLNLSTVGQYIISYQSDAPLVLEPATTASPTAAAITERVVTVEDTVGPGIVTGLKAYAGNGYVQLSWTNPTNDDFAGLDIYRSTVFGQKGTKIASALSKETNSYDDYAVVNGAKYYYTVVAFDLYGNNGLSSVQVSALPLAPKIVAADSGSYDYSVTEEPQEEQEVKSDETVKDNNDEDEDLESTDPVIGIIILILLILLGLYLLYLQNPKWFGWMAFWGKRKKGSLNLSALKKSKNSKIKSLKTKTKK